MPARRLRQPPSDGGAWAGTGDGANPSKTEVGGVLAGHNGRSRFAIKALRPHHQITPRLWWPAHAGEWAHVRKRDGGHTH